MWTSHHAALQANLGTHPPTGCNSCWPEDAPGQGSPHEDVLKENYTVLRSRRCVSSGKLFQLKYSQRHNCLTTLPQNTCRQLRDNVARRTRAPACTVYTKSEQVDGVNAEGRTPDFRLIFLPRFPNQVPNLGEATVETCYKINMKTQALPGHKENSPYFPLSSVKTRKQGIISTRILSSFSNPSKLASEIN